MKLTSEWFAHKTAHFVEIDTKTLFIDIVSESIPCNSNDSCGFIPFRILTNWNSMCGLNEVKKQSVSAGNWNAVFFFVYLSCVFVRYFAYWFAFSLPCTEMWAKIWDFMRFDWLNQKSSASTGSATLRIGAKRVRSMRTKRTVYRFRFTYAPLKL